MVFTKEVGSGESMICLLLLNIRSWGQILLLMGLGMGI